MADLTVNIANGGHDGQCNTDDSAFSKTTTEISLGLSAGAKHAFWRFANLTVPAGAEIDAAVIRLIASGIDSTSVDLNVYFEAADNVTSPTSGADANGRPLTSAIAWSSVPSFTSGNNYDTPEVKTILQDVIDRPGWASGQAIGVHIIDNGSTGRRRVASYEHGTYTAAQLVITYSTPILGPIAESFSADDAIDSEITDSGESDDSFASLDITDALLTTSPVSGLFNVGDLIDAVAELQGAVPETFSVDDVSEGYKEAESEFSNDFGFADLLDAFHYSQWLRENLDKAKQRFFLTLTGINDGLSDVEIPIGSLYARKQSGKPTFLQVVVPGWLAWSQPIIDRPNGTMIVDMGYEVDGIISLREQILDALLEQIRPDEGPSNRSITLMGHKTVSYANNVITISKDKATYRSEQNGNIVYRFAHIDPYLNAGDTCIVGNDTFTVSSVIYIIGALRSSMEIREGAI
jgi:hypothetical protein